MHVAIAQAVTDLLNTAGVQTTLGRTFTATREEVPVKEVGTNGLVVAVYPGNRTRTTSTRDDGTWDFETYVFIGERVVPATDVPALIDFGFRLEAELWKKENRRMADAYLNDEAINIPTAPFFPDALKADHEFRTQITLRYTGVT